MTIAGAVSGSRYETSTPCTRCDGTGWVECLDDRRHRDGCRTPDECCCSAVVPCDRCRGAA